MKNKQKSKQAKRGIDPTTRQQKIIAPPEAMLKAAQKAEAVFSIGAYYRPLYIMRQKGHSWRYISEWVKQFNIELSHVHLNRLFAQESERLSQLTRKELSERDMPEEMVNDLLRKSDPTERLASADAQDVSLEEKGEATR